jgi:hypothetical protein
MPPKGRLANQGLDHLFLLCGRCLQKSRRRLLRFDIDDGDVENPPPASTYG